MLFSRHSAAWPPQSYLQSVVGLNTSSVAEKKKNALPIEGVPGWDGGPFAPRVPLLQCLWSILES